MDLRFVNKSWEWVWTDGWAGLRIGRRFMVRFAFGGNDWTLQTAVLLDTWMMAGYWGVWHGIRRVATNAHPAHT